MIGRFGRIALAGVLVFGASLPTFAQAAKVTVTGVWKGAMDTQMGAVDVIITIDGDAPLAGSVQLADYTGKIENGSLTGNAISFATTVQPGTITFEGTVAGDEMRLNVTGTTGNKMTLVATRQKKAVRVEGGWLEGVRGRDPSIAVFRGVPFAAPPVGDLRWRGPRPVGAWSGVRMAAAFGANCMQTIVDEKKPWTYEFMAHGPVSEDCLFLNVWTGARAASERRPVYVYVHGGANTEGSGSVPAYDGEGLAAKGIVVVTVNYRLGVLGFFTHPELTKESDHRASGNYALLDLIAALRWVRDNIAAFGGDPANVTLGGQSAGAGNTHSLVASPLARGLFHRAIAESGSSLTTGGNTRTLATQEALGVRFAEAKGARTLAELRKLTWQDLTAPVPAPAGATAPVFRFGVVVDGHVLPASPKEAFAAGSFHDVPTLTGSNKHEYGATPRPEITADAFRTQARQRFGDLADAFLALYPAGSDGQARASQNESAWDQARVSTRLWAVDRARTARTPVFTYFWDHPLPGPDAERYGAFHTGEVPYAMNSLAMSQRPFTDADRRIADTLSTYWANFIATGDPNGAGLPTWPRVSTGRAVTMQVGDANAAIPVAGTPAKQAFWEQFLTRPRPVVTQ